MEIFYDIQISSLSLYIYISVVSIYLVESFFLLPDASSDSGLEEDRSTKSDRKVSTVFTINIQKDRLGQTVDPFKVSPK